MTCCAIYIKSTHTSPIITKSASVASPTSPPPALQRSLTTDASHRNGLSRSYYATMLYREVQRDSVLVPLMRSFMELPPGEQSVGEAYRLLAMWRFPELGPRATSDVQG